MTIPSWQYPDGYLDFIVSLSEDPPGSYGSTLGEHGFESARVLMSYLPPFFTEDPYLRDLLWAQGIELDAVRAAIDTILGSFYVAFSNEWGLQLWEEFVGALVAPGGLTFEQRQSTVRAALNIGAVTVEDFQELVGDFIGVDSSLVLITEDFPNYAVEFVVQSGLNADQVAALEFIVRKFLPAHLDVTFVYGGFIVDVGLVGDTI